MHLDVGSVRHWPRMTHDQLARVFPNGRTVHVPSDGHPLSGYALALADIEKRGSSVPSQMSLNAAQAAGVEVAAAANGARKKSLFATLFHTDEDDDDSAQAAPSIARPTATASRAGTFSLASVDSKPEPARTALVPVPAARPQGPAAAPVLASAANDDASAPAATGRDQWALAGLAEPPRPPGSVQPLPRVPISNPDTFAGLTPWPIRETDNDRVPLDMVLAYAAQPQRERDPDTVARAESKEEESVRATAASSIKIASLRENFTAVPKKNFVRAAVAGQIVPAKPVIQAASPGMRYDDPWLRAMILAPRLSDSMTATLYGEPDFTELRALMNKPTTSVAMSFANDPYPGITADRFSGEAVVFLTTYAFPQRTAWLQ